MGMGYVSIMVIVLSAFPNCHYVNDNSSYSIKKMIYITAIETPLRQSKKHGLLGIIDSYMPEGHAYTSRDSITYGHETLHGISARLRNKYKEKYGTNINVIYIKYNQFLILEHPPITISQIAKEVPPDLRDDIFKLYLIRQRKYWNRQPLYILEECNCYLYGALIGYEVGQKFNADYSMECAKKFLEYVKIMSSLCDDNYKRVFELYIKHFEEMTI